MDGGISYINFFKFMFISTLSFLSIFSLKLFGEENWDWDLINLRFLETFWKFETFFISLFKELFRFWICSEILFSFLFIFFSFELITNVSVYRDLYLSSFEFDRFFSCFIRFGNITGFFFIETSSSLQLFALFNLLFIKFRFSYSWIIPFIFVSSIKT